MSTIYLDFEKPIEELNEQIVKTKEVGEKGKVDITGTLTELEKKLENTTKEALIPLLKNYNLGWNL